MAAIGLAEALLVQAQTCSGTYILSLTSDDASYLWLDNPARRVTLLSSKALIKNSGQHAAQTGSATVALTASNHGIVVHFGAQDGENVLILAYIGSDTGNSSVVVPATGYSCRWCSPGSQPSPSQTYETLDRAPLAGLAYYRQRLVDHDDTTAYPPIVAIMMTTRRAATNGLAAQVVPNPALIAGPLNLWVQQDVTVPVPLTINDLQRRVLHRQALPAALVTELPLALRGGGVYLLHLNSATNTITQKLMVQ